MEGPCYLLKRLHFIPALKKQLNASSTRGLFKISKEDQAKYALALAYALIEAEKMYQRALQGYEKPSVQKMLIPALNTIWGLGSLFELL